MSNPNYTELTNKINAYRTRELSGERLPKEEFEHYIGLKRELYHIESKLRLINARQTKPKGEANLNRLETESSTDTITEKVKTAEVYDFEPMLIRIEKKSRLRMLLDRFRREQW